MEHLHNLFNTNLAQNVALKAVKGSHPRQDFPGGSPSSDSLQVVCISDSQQQVTLLESLISRSCGIALQAIPASAVQSSRAAGGEAFLVDVDFCAQPGRTISDLHSRFPNAAIIALLRTDSQEGISFVLEAGADEWLALETATPQSFSYAVRHAVQRRRSVARRQVESENHDALLAGLARGVAHDVNNYLTAITCGAELLSIREVDGGNHRTTQNILQAARSAGELATDLLIAARPPVGENSKIDPRQLMDRALRLLGYSIRKAGVEIFQRHPNELPDILGEPGELTRRTLAMLARAIQRATPDTDITLRSRYENGPEGSRWVLEMESAGQSEALSAVSAGPPACEYVQERTASAPGSLRVLVVDDERPIRFFAAEALRSLGYDVRTACDGVEAVDLLRADGGSVDLVMVDLVMPRMNGWEVVAELRKIHPEARVLISSGFDKMLHSNRGQEVQAEFLPKPYGVSELQASVEAALAGSPIGSA